ncbi:MAG: SMP-30/gluconolactonase/LRE family protein [Actinomycetota bacterium]|jgi:sugar lactone lactonase YvrE|nr:SMP-30/gluconolactonase/LRE family protein [Actinomycetota bacterium]
MSDAPIDRHAEPFVDGLHFGESPRWHEGRLWYSDFFDHAVFSVDEAGDRRREVELDDRPSGLGWLPDGRLLVVAMQAREVLRCEPDGRLVPHGTLTPWATFHGNDMVVDAAGRAYVGNFGFDLYAFYAGKASPCTTSLVRIDPDGTSTEAAADLFFPNGSVLFPDGHTLVVAESMALQLTAFTVGADGTLQDRRVWASLENCAPDGICLDADGAIWVANALGPECRRVAEGGEVLDRVATSQTCFACMLGGSDRRTLYCVTGPTSEEEPAAAARHGRIETCRVGVPGDGRP